jgi:hypothetical protein
MVNFKKLISKEAQHRIAQRDEYYQKRLVEFRNLSKENLVASTKYYLTQMQAPKHWNPGDPVYDAVFYYIIIPELLRRLG